MPEYTGQVTHVELAAIPLWLIPLLPLLGAVTNALFGRRLQASGWAKGFSKKHHIGSAGVTAVAVGAMVGALLLAAISFAHLWSLEPGSRYLYSHAWQMVRIGTLEASFAFAMDPLSALMTMIITGVGGLIHVYAAAYMEKEPAYWRFFTYLNLFVFSMLLLVLGDNFIVMFFGWEGVGLCSYLLIGFWYKDYDKATAGMKAFVVNRVGDWGFVCGMALLFWGLGGAWLAGSYIPDVEHPRFISVLAEPLPHGHGAAHGDGHAEGAGFELIRSAHAQPGHEEHGHGHDDHGDREHGHGHDPDVRLPAPPRGPTDPAQLTRGGQGWLTFTSHPGARVYFGVATIHQLERHNVPPCSQQEGWSAATYGSGKGGSGQPQLGSHCYAVSPFSAKTIASGPHKVAVVPGDGAVILGDGNEVAALLVQIQADKETLITPVGATLTFRELHDQLVIKDASGTAVLREHLKSKSVWGIALITLACLCFFVGATGKSAQIPLFVWLPDAMAGPTPVSALIHAATMVTAGVYMIARLNFLFSLSPAASGTVALVGALTALFAATIGFFQYDIKKVLAYSTVSQLGFMFIGVGVGAYWAGVFHLMTHAFFKACLFLGSGSVIHGMHHVVHDDVGAQDMRNMGGLKAQMPYTARTYFVACLAITAAPIPFFAGFWSKDEILWKAFNTHATGPVPGWLIYGMGLVAALGTSFYMWRSYYLTFEGPHARADIPKKVHESPLAMWGVLAVLAGLSAVAGVLFGFSTHFIGGHGEPILEEWLHPVTAHHSAEIGNLGLLIEYVLMAISVAGAIAAWALAKDRYGDERSPTWADEERRLPGFAMLHNKYWVDEIYQRAIVGPFLRTRLVFSEADRWVVDGIVNGAGRLAQLAAWISGAIDRYLVDGLVNLIANATLKAGDGLRTMQTGRVQSYVYGILAGVAFLAIVQYFLS